MRKYVYRIYSSNGTINCEKYPVIYENEKYIYYKIASKSLLDYKTKHGYGRCLDRVEEYPHSGFKNVNIIVLNKPTKEQLEALRDRMVKEDKQSRIDKLAMEINRARDIISSCEKQIKRIEEE